MTYFDLLDSTVTVSVVKYDSLTQRDERLRGRRESLQEFSAFSAYLRGLRTPLRQARTLADEVPQSGVLTDLGSK